MGRAIDQLQWDGGLLRAVYVLARAWSSPAPRCCRRLRSLGPLQQRDEIRYRRAPRGDSAAYRGAQEGSGAEPQQARAEAKAAEPLVVSRKFLSGGSHLLREYPSKPILWRSARHPTF